MAPVVTLDSLGLAPDFVKLHLEGAELAALAGGRETLIRHRPVLAVTVYHNADGIWKTPAWLMETLPGSPADLAVAAVAPRLLD